MKSYKESFTVLFFLLEFLIIYKNKIINKWPQKLTMDTITLVTAFYKIKSKHS